MADLDPAAEPVIELAPNGKLTLKQRSFVWEYLYDLNATQAATRAGYSPDTAGQQGHAMLKVPEIKAAVDIAMAQRQARINVTTDHVLQEMAILANANLEHYEVDDTGHVVLTEGAPAGAMRAIQSIKRSTTVNARSGEVTYHVEIKLWDKPSPLKLMGRHVGLFPDKIEHTGPGGGPVQIEQVRSVIVDPKEHTE